MRKITLYGPAIDKRGHFRDAGEVLVVGAADNEEADITTEAGEQLLERGIAVTQTAAREDAHAPNPLDHDGDGKPGGVADATPLTAEEKASLDAPAPSKSAKR